MNNIKCVILDIDGTITDFNGKISDFTKKVIGKLLLKNIYVIFASGRYTQSVVDISKTSLATNIIVADNGSRIYDYVIEKELYINNFPKKILKEIWNICLKYNIDSIYNALDLRYRKFICLDKKYNEANDYIIENYDDISKDISQVVLLGTNDSDFNNCLNELRTKKIIINNISRGKNGIFCADINYEKVTKGTAIKFLCKMLNLEKNNVLCIGDSMNDMELFKNCGIKVAMKNSDDTLKSNADYITDFSNENDGAAKFLTRLL